MAGFWELILVFNEITSLWWAENFQIWKKKRMWSWWGLDYFCHKKQLSATFLGGHGFWESSLVYAIIYANIIWLNFNFMCVHLKLIFTLLEYEINAWNHWFFFKSIWIKKNAPMACTVQANSYKTMMCSRIVMKLCI
jgi:hypothetical protein